MKKTNKTVITVLLILVVAGIIFYPKLKPLFAAEPARTTIGPGGPGGAPRGGPGGGAGQMNRQALSVSGFLITPTRMIENLNYIGTLRADEEVDLSFETSGKIINIFFTEGTRVKKGDLLAKINDKPLQAQLEKLLAQQKLAEAKEFRQRSLLDRDAISQESYDQIVTELRTIQADINLVRARISETELRAPFDGIIGLRYVSEGAYTNANTKIARLVKMSPLKIDFSISERYSDQVKVGYPVTFTVDEKQYQAKVYAVDPKVESNTKTVLLRAMFPNKNEELMPGRYAGIVLQLNELNNTIAIPTEALVPEMEGEIVYVMRNGKAETVKVSTGLRTEALVQVTDGLKFGDTLLTTGILQLRQSMPVMLDTLVASN